MDVRQELGTLEDYQPRSNFQRGLLVDEVARQVMKHRALDEAALLAVQRPAAVPMVTDFLVVKTDVPMRETAVHETGPAYARPAVQRDYLAREAQNRSLGQAGERFALSYERWRLIQLGVGQLAERVEHVADTEGDGLGYDIRSFDHDGSERYIEVKTTSFGVRTPFFVTSNEVRFSRDRAPQFRLYRLFDFRVCPRLFELAGPIDQHCHLDPTGFRASFGPC